MFNGRIEWTSDRDAALSKLWREGLATAQIGARLGVSKSSVIGRAHRIGLPKRTRSPQRKVSDEFEWTPGRIEKLVEMWNNGVSIDVMARHLQTKPHNVSKTAHEIGLTPRTPGATICYPNVATAKARMTVEPVPAGHPGFKLRDLEPGQCKWPITPDNAGPHDHLFCGAQRAPSFIAAADVDPNYCPVHALKQKTKLVGERRDFVLDQSLNR